MDQSFTKYAQSGAYHWNNLYDGGWIKASPRLHARYDVPIQILSQNLELEGARGVDLGCGDGVFLYKGHRRGARIIGVDASKAGLELARRELDRRGVAKSDLVLASCYCTGLPGSGLDFAVSIEVVEHLDDLGRFLDEVYRILRPGGWFVCTTPQRAVGQGREEVRDPFHVREFVAQELSAELATRFVQVEVFGIHPEWLDRLYFAPKAPRMAGVAIRTVVRAAAALRLNPFARVARVDPDRSWQTLVGIARKPLSTGRVGESHDHRAG